MDRIETLLDLLDRWDETLPSDRATPEEFCSEHPALLDEFRQLLGQRGVLTALLNGDDSLELNPEAMIERMQDGRFPVVQFHDQGGLGWVYLAKDRELGRMVALKCLQPEPATDPEARRRFVREAEITARLEHPGVVPIYGLGGLPQQASPSYAMRFVQGDTLRAIIRDFHESSSTKQEWSSLEGTRILRSFVTVCETIAYAHSKNVIHRDLKSSNVMIGAFGETLVLDWGLAKLLTEPEDPPVDSAPNNSETQQQPQSLPLGATLSGATLGTVGFMSPEQARGDWEHVKSAADIFSLGAILYQILTNQAPYQGEGALAAARTCSYQTPQAIATSVPKPLAAVCMKAMHADPTQRYNSPLELKNDIERYLADEPVSARRDSVYERLQRRLRRHRVAVQMGGLMALLAIVMLSTFLSFAAKKNDELKTAYDNEEAAKDEALQQSYRVQKALLTSVHENYAANMAQVSQALSDRQPARLADMLIKAGPRIGSPIDPRGVEWWMSWNKAYGGLQPIPSNGKSYHRMHLVDHGKKAIAMNLRAIDDESIDLDMIDTTTGEILFHATTDGFYQFDVDKDAPPCSDDGSTLAIPQPNGIQIYVFENDQYRLDRTLPVDGQVDLGWNSLLLSANGSIVVGYEWSTVHVWNRNNDSYKTLRTDSEEEQHPAKTPRLSPDGRFLARISSEKPVVRDLTDGKLILLPSDSYEPFYGITFGQYDTLLALNKDSVLTFAVDSTQPLTELWRTKLSHLDGWSASNEGFSELIEIESANQSVDRETIQLNIHQGDPEKVIHSTSLAILTYGQDHGPNLHLLKRDRWGRNFFGSDIYEKYDVKSETPARYVENGLPNLRWGNDISSDQKTILLKSDDGQYSILESNSWERERVDLRTRATPILHVALTKDGKLWALSNHGSYRNGHYPPDFIKETADDGTVSETLPRASLIGVSNDLTTTSFYRDEKLTIRSIDSRFPEQSIELAPQLSELSRSGWASLCLWNRGLPDDANLNVQPENSINFEMIFAEPSTHLLKPIFLSWALFIENCDKGTREGEEHKRSVHLEVLDYVSSKTIFTQEIQGATCDLTKISSNGRSILLLAHIEENTGDRNQLHTWSVGDDHSIHNGPVLDLNTRYTCIDVSPSGLQVAMGSADGDVDVMDLASGSLITRIKAHERALNAVMFSPDGRRLVTAASDNTVRLYSTRDWAELFEYSCQASPTCLAMDNEGRTLAIGDYQGFVSILNTATRKDVYDLATLWLKNDRTAAKGEAAILSELWAEFVGTGGRSEEEVQAGLDAIESVRGKVREMPIDELRRQFQLALPPMIDDFE